MITNKNIQLPNPLSLGLLFYFLKGKMFTGRLNLYIRPGRCVGYHLDQSTAVQVPTCRNLSQNTPQQYHPSNQRTIQQRRNTPAAQTYHLCHSSQCSGMEQTMQCRIICNCIHENACQYNIDNDWRCVNMVLYALSLVILMTTVCLVSLG